MKNVFGGDEKDKKIVEVDSHQILENEHRPEIYGRTWVKIGTRYHSIPNKGFFIKTITEYDEQVEEGRIKTYNSRSGADVCIFRDGVQLMDVKGIKIEASVDDIAAPTITIDYAPQWVEIEAENPKLVESKKEEKKAAHPSMSKIIFCNECDKEMERGHKSVVQNNHGHFCSYTCLNLCSSKGKDNGKQ